MVLRSPDASLERKLGCFKPKQQDSYPPLCPDFVVELRSPTDKLEDTSKMWEYINNGARLG